ncbi:hypothetical protein ACH5RR_034981 [Cinchona calisaya]|uniref:Uncharacterized protein n=1 Tax=Cinchona calisaya TaxID=153742 RepID=A0ABD2YG22_9GENT
MSKGAGIEVVLTECSIQDAATKESKTKKPQVLLFIKSAKNNAKGTNEASSSNNNIYIFELFGLAKAQVEFLSQPGIVRSRLESLIIRDVNWLSQGNTRKGNATQDLPTGHKGKGKLL